MVTITAECLRIQAEVDGDKRTYAPYKTRWICPDCGTEHTLNHADDYYFSYPVYGKTQRMTLMCHVCDDAGRPNEKGEVELRIDLAVTLVATHGR